MGPWTVLIVDDVDGHRIADLLLDWGIEVLHCGTIHEAREVLSAQPVSQVFCKASLPDGSYRDLVRIAKAVQPQSRVVVLIPRNSGQRTFQEVIESGAFDSIPAPPSRPDVQWEVLHAMRQGSEHAA